MIEIRAGRRRLDVDPQEFQRQAERYVSRRANVNGLGDVLVEILKFTDKLYSIPLVEAVGFTMWNSPPTPDTMTVYVSMPLKRGDESITEAFKEVSYADGELARATHTRLPMGTQFFNSLGIDPDRMEKTLRSRKKSSEGQEKFLWMAVFNR